MSRSARRVGSAPRWPGALEAVAVLGIIGLAVLRLPTFGIDYATYRAGAAALAHGLYDGPLETGLGPMPFTYPPFAAVVLVPTTLLSTWRGVRLWNAATLLCLWWVIGLAMTGASHRWTSDTRRRLWRLAALGLAIASGPMADHLGWGQINVLLMALVLADVLGRIPWLPRGVGAGLAAGIKLTPGVFIVYFLIARQWRVALVAGGTFAGTVLLAALLQWDTSWTFATEVLPDLSARVGLGDPLAIGNQSVMAMMARAGLPGGWASAASLGLAALVLVLAARADLLPAMCMVGLLSALVVPVGWSHHFVYLVPATVLLALAGRRWSVALAVGIGVVALGRGPRIGSDMVASGLAGGTLLQNSLGVAAIAAIAGLAALPRQGSRPGSQVAGAHRAGGSGTSGVDRLEPSGVHVVDRPADHEVGREHGEAADATDVPA